MIKHIDLVHEEYVQGLVARLSSIDEGLEEVPFGTGDRGIESRRRELEGRYDALVDELSRQLINWHRDSFKVSFVTHIDPDLALLKSIVEPKEKAQ